MCLGQPSCISNRLETGNNERNCDFRLGSVLDCFALLSIFDSSFGEAAGRTSSCTSCYSTRAVERTRSKEDGEVIRKKYISYSERKARHEGAGKKIPASLVVHEKALNGPFSLDG